MAKVYIVSFRSNDDRRPSKFIVLADNMKSAISMAWEHGGADFQARFDKPTGQAQEINEGRCGCCEVILGAFGEVVAERVPELVAVAKG